MLTLQGLRSPELDKLVFGVTALGNVVVALPVMCGTFLALLWVRRRPDALAVAVCAVPIALGHVLKVVVSRPRPEYSISEVAYTGMSFPSGHALFALLFGGLLIVLAEELIHPLAIRRGMQVTVALLVLAIGISRVYLGVHWPSDVIGGYLFRRSFVGDCIGSARQVGKQGLVTRLYWSQDRFGRKPGFLPAANGVA